MSLHHLIISAWVEVLGVSKFRPDKGEAKEALLPFTNTNIWGYMEIPIPENCLEYSGLLREPTQKDLPITLTTFTITTTERDYHEKIIDVTGVFWPRARTFEHTQSKELHIVVRLDDNKICCVKPDGDGWKQPLLFFMGSTDHSLVLNKTMISFLSTQQLRAMGFIAINQPMQLLNKAKDSEPEFILVVVPINLPKYNKWLPGVYEKTDFWGQGRSVLGRGSMIGYLNKNLLDKTESRTLRKGENIPVVIVDDHSNLKWLTGESSQQPPSRSSNPVTPTKARAAMKDRFLRKKAFQTSHSPPDASSSQTQSLSSPPYPTLPTPNQQLAYEFEDSTTPLDTLTSSPSFKRQRCDSVGELEIQEARTGHKKKGKELALSEDDSD